MENQTYQSIIQHLLFLCGIIQQIEEVPFAERPGEWTTALFQLRNQARAEYELGIKIYEGDKWAVFCGTKGYINMRPIPNKRGK